MIFFKGGRGSRCVTPGVPTHVYVDIHAVFCLKPHFFGRGSLSVERATNSSMSLVPRYIKYSILFLLVIRSKCLLLKGGVDDEWGNPEPPSSYALIDK